MPFARRGARTEEYIAAMRALWAEDDASFHGEFVDFARMSCNPKPLAGHVPIHIGGHSEAAAKRAGRIGDGFFPATGAQVDVAPLIALARSTATWKITGRWCWAAAGASMRASQPSSPSPAAGTRNSGAGPPPRSARRWHP